MAVISSNKAKAVYISVAILGGLASIFGIAGAFNGVKQGNGTFKYALDYSYCTWPSSPAAGLGIVGFFLILAAQITSNATGGCICCCGKQSSSMSGGGKTGAIICLTLSWILTIMSSIFLLEGGILNSGAVHMKVEEVYDVAGSSTDIGVFCYYPATWPLLVGGVLGLLATGLSLLFFHIIVMNSRSSSEDINNMNGGTTATGYPPSYNIQMPTIPTTNTVKNNPPPPAAAAAFPAPPPGSYHSAIPVASHAAPGAGYY